MDSIKLLETRENGVCNFDYFAVDMADEAMTLNGHTMPTGQITCDIANLSRDFNTELFKLSGHLMEAWGKAGNEEYSIANYVALRERIHAIISYVADTAPFSCFDVAGSLRTVDQIYSDERLKDYEKCFRASIDELMGFDKDWFSQVQRDISTATELVKIYVYLVNDTINYATAVLNFSEVITRNDLRTKTELAKYTLAFFDCQPIMDELVSHNAVPEVQGITMRPRVTMIPVIPWNGDVESIDNLQIKRRVYYGRLMDFFVSELFEGLRVGHYVRRCKLCDRYFLVTDARRQYYCQTINPEFGTTCANAAKHRKTRHSKGELEKQKVAGSPVYVLYKRRYDSIRKDKSTGKFVDIICDMAARIARDNYERALIDIGYAENQYPDDMILTKLYEAAEKKQS